MVPGKVDEFLCVLSEFEKDPESRTSLELLTRLKPVLSDWPELLRDFAAFLHPDQARECGLVEHNKQYSRLYSVIFMAKYSTHKVSWYKLCSS